MNAPNVENVLTVLNISLATRVLACLSVLVSPGSNPYPGSTLFGEIIKFSLSPEDSKLWQFTWTILPKSKKLQHPFPDGILHPSQIFIRPQDIFSLNSSIQIQSSPRVQINLVQLPKMRLEHKLINEEYDGEKRQKNISIDEISSIKRCKCRPSLNKS